MNRLPSIRRWGVAALTGVTLFGGLSIVGAGVAGAAVPTVTAALSTGASATTISGTQTAGGSGNSVTLTVAGTVASGDQITLTLACPTTGTAVFAAITDTATADFGTATIGTNSAGCSTATFASTGTTSNPTLVLSPITYTTHDVTSQALSISGTYATIGQPTTSFTVPTDANVLWYSVSSNSGSVTSTRPSGATTVTTALSPITISEPTGLGAGAITTSTAITLTLPTGDTWVSPAGNTVAAYGITDVSALTGTTTNTLTLPAPSAVGSSGAQITFSGLSVVTTSASGFGAQKVTIAVGAVQVTASASVESVLGSATTIAGLTPDATVAAEFEAAFPSGVSSAVLATDAPATNGSDALAASYLEGTLHTGLLITPTTSLGADAQLALQLEGVSTVYVVGGPLAITPAVIAQIQALPAYTTGGLVKTGSNIKVVGPIYGANADNTAAAIATYFGSTNASLNLSGAYTAAAYNDTTGSQSAVAPTGSLSTAFVVASSDWQDAMTLAPLAYADRIPVILNGDSASTTLSATAQAALTSLNVKQVIVVGGQLAFQNSVEAAIEALGIKVLRIAGIDATDTAGMVATFATATAANTGLGWTPTSVLASHADYWSDALGAAALGGTNQQPIILVESPLVIGQYTTALLPTLGALGVGNLTVLGGPLAMPSSTVNSLLTGL